MVSIATAPIHFHGNCILILSPAGCLAQGSANKGKEGERPPIRSSIQGESINAPHSGQATPNPHRMFCPASPHLNALVHAVTHFYRLLLGKALVNASSPGKPLTQQGN